MKIVKNTYHHLPIQFFFTQFDDLFFTLTNQTLRVSKNKGKYKTRYLS